MLVFAILIGFSASSPYMRAVADFYAEQIPFFKKDWRSVVGLKPTEHLEELRPDLEKPIKPDLDRMQPGVTLLSGLIDGKLGLRLVDENGAVIHDWPLDFFDIDVDGKVYHYQALIHGTYLYPNGDALVNLDQKGIYRIDACGRIKWISEARTHHSIDVDENGAIWAPEIAHGYLEQRLYRHAYNLDLIVKIDPETGKTLDRIDLTKVFLDSENEGLAVWENPDYSDLLHVNDVEVLSSADAPAFPMFSAGDILVSSRLRNALFVIDGKTKLIKWSRVGPMQFHHDPDFERDGAISIFDNRGAELATAENNWLGDRGGSRILSIRPGDYAFKTLYSSTEAHPFYSPRRGKHQRLANGDILIAETDSGRAFEITPGGDIVWQYVNKFNDREVGWITGALRYPSSYADFPKSCPAASK